MADLTLKLLLLTPTRFEVLTKALDAIGRSDLAEKLEAKKEQFAVLFKPQLQDSDTLEQKEYDAVCDGIEEAAGKLKTSARSELSTSNVKKQIKLMTGETQDGLLHEFITASLITEEPIKVPADTKEKNVKESEKDDDTTVLNHSQDKVNHSTPTSSDGGSLPKTTNEVDGFISTENSAPSKTGEMSSHADDLSTGMSSMPTTATPNVSNYQGPGDDVVPDCNEDKDGEPKKKSSNKGTPIKEAKQQGAHGDHGGARPKEKKGKLPVFQCAEEGINEATVHHGTLVGMQTSGKEPKEDECLSPMSSTGQISPEVDSATAVASNQSYYPSSATSYKQPKGFSSQGVSSFTNHSCGYNSSSLGSVSQQGIPGNPAFVTSQGASGYTDYSLGYCSTAFGSGAPQDTPTNSAAQYWFLQQTLTDFFAGQPQSTHQPPISSSSGAPATDSPVPLRSYSKGGYSVGISNGTLCDSSAEKGVVMMKSGTQFYIAIANNNDCDAEVDITFGGIFLGVWVVGAKQAFKVEGSSWTTGRLRFFSKSDPNKPASNKEFGLESNFDGKIVLEFKPQVVMLKLVVKHLWIDKTEEILMPDFKTASIADLKQEINKKFVCGVSCLIMGGKVLPEDTMMSSHALENTDEVIQVLYKKEELQIESPGMNPVTFSVDPFEVSIQKIKDFVKEKFNIEVNQQHLSLDGQNLDDIDRLQRLSDIFTTAKKKPVVRVATNREINIDVSQPDGNQLQVQVNWFATVKELKDKLVEQSICDINATLMYNGMEITADGRKKLVDLKFKPKSAITVCSRERTHRGFSAGALVARPNTRSVDSGTTRGFTSGLTRGFSSRTTRGSEDDECEFSDPYPSASMAFRSDPGGVQCDSGPIRGKEGVAILCGDEESVYNQFQVDRRELKFSKEKAVELIIQLIENDRPFSEQSPWAQTGPMCFPCPPPVPE